MATELFHNKYREPSARAIWHDYKGGIYFVTICTLGRKHYFGEIVNGQMQLSEIGKIADKCFQDVHKHFPHANVPLYVVMPNHVHFIIILEDASVETQNFASLQTPQQKFGPQSRNLGSVVRGFKIGVKKYATSNNISFAWQPRFHDHIIRHQTEMNQIAEYIEQNPQKWNQDEFFD